MKKAMIATTVLLVVSFVTTLVLGAALGTQGLRALFADGGAVDRLVDRVADRATVELYTDGGFDEDDRQYLFQTDRLTLEGSPKTLQIAADLGAVRVRGTDGAQVEVVLEQYSRRASPSPCFSAAAENGVVTLRPAGETDGVYAVLTVFVPYALSALSVETGLGDVELSGVTADALQVQTGTGDIELTRVTAGEAQLHTETGDIEVEEAVEIAASLSAEAGTGDVHLRLPVRRAFRLTYTVDLGSAELEDIPTEWLQDTKRGAGASGTIVRGTDGAQYTVHVALGELEIERAG